MNSYDDNKDILDDENFECPFCRQRPPQLNFPFITPGQIGPGFGPPVSPGFGAPAGPPSGPPPVKTPAKPDKGKVGLYAVDPGAIRPCRYQFVYIWLDNGRSFWAWLTFVGPRSAAGYRWTGNRWRYFGIDLRRIDSFQCFKIEPGYRQVLFIV
ncbi:MAG: hypothetical protein ACOZCL_01045 [Bacillota bacterium]